MTIPTGSDPEGAVPRIHIYLPEKGSILIQGDPVFLERVWGVLESELKWDLHAALREGGSLVLEPPAAAEKETRVKAGKRRTDG